MPTLLWLQTGACSGDSMSLLNLESPNLLETLATYKIKLLWHPSLSLESPLELEKLINQIKAGKQELTVLCVEGAMLKGPKDNAGRDTGLYDTFFSHTEKKRLPKTQLVKELCQTAQFVLAMGTCACYGGVAAAPPNLTDAVGLQWLGDNPQGGLLEEHWRSKGGLPVINIAGCPAHPTVMIDTVLALLVSDPTSLKLDDLNRPAMFYSSMVHQGCTRNEYHEYDMEEQEFGHRGCLFFNLGCQGPRTQSTCNVILWNNQKSKTRAGVPCFGCTAPNFPKNQDLFKTEKIDDIPVELPFGVKRPYYIGYKGLAKKAVPQRVNDRNMDP